MKTDKILMSVLLKSWQNAVQKLKVLWNHDISHSHYITLTTRSHCPACRLFRKMLMWKYASFFRFTYLKLECAAVSWWTELLEFAVKHITIQSIHLRDLKHLCHLWSNFYTVQFFLFYYEHTICGNPLRLNSTGSRVCLYCLRSNLKQWGILKMED